MLRRGRRWEQEAARRNAWERGPSIPAAPPALATATGTPGWFVRIMRVWLTWRLSATQRDVLVLQDTLANARHRCEVLRTALAALDANPGGTGGTGGSRRG